MTRTLWIRDEYLHEILRGAKTVEVRVGYPNIVRLRPGDELRLNDRYLVRIRRIARYPGFEALLAAEDPQTIAPHLSAEELLAALRAIYPAENEALGAVALELECIGAA